MEKKLSLNKITITNLQNSEMGDLRAGVAAAAFTSGCTDGPVCQGTTLFTASACTKMTIGPFCHSEVTFK